MEQERPDPLYAYVDDKLQKQREAIDSFEKQVQQQIADLHKQLTILSNEFAQLKREVFQQKLTLGQEMAKKILSEAGHADRRQRNWVEGEVACGERIHGLYLQATEQMKHCKSLDEMRKGVESFLKNVNGLLAALEFPRVFLG